MKVLDGSESESESVRERAKCKCEQRWARAYSTVAIACGKKRALNFES